MARLRTRVERAAVLHRQAAAAIAATASAVDGYSPSSAPAEQYAEQHELAARLRTAAADLVPGWLGSGLDAVSAATPAGGSGVPAFLRLGMAHPLDDAAFPAIAPLFGTGHLAIDADARDPRVAGLLRSVLLRLVAAAIPGALHVRVIDAAGEGDTIAAFAGLPNLPAPITDHGGMQSVLIEADNWIRSTPPAGAVARPADAGQAAHQAAVPAAPPAAAQHAATQQAAAQQAAAQQTAAQQGTAQQATTGQATTGQAAAEQAITEPGPAQQGAAQGKAQGTAQGNAQGTAQGNGGESNSDPTDTVKGPPPDRYFVLVIASLPELTDGSDLARIAHLARVGVAHRLHLIVAGWPPPPLTAETTQAPLPHSTQVSLRNPYVWVGDPPGATYSGTGVGPARLNAPVYLDPEPPADVIRRVCAQLAEQEPGTVEPPMWAPSPQRWRDYVGAAQRLDAVRRQAAKVVTEQTAAVKRVRAELATARRQIAIQQNRIGDMVSDGQPVPLRPTAADLSAADAALGRLAQVALQRAAAHAAVMSTTGSFPTVTGSIPTGQMVNPGTNTGGFPVVTPRPGPAPQHPNTSGWPGPAAYGRNPAGPGQVQVTSPPRPDGPAPYPQPAGDRSQHPGHPPVSGPGGRPPAGGFPPVSGPGGRPPAGGYPPVSGPGGRPPAGGYPPVSGPGGRPPAGGYPPVSGPGGRPPVSGPGGYPPVSGPGGHPPVSGVPNPLHVNTGSYPTVNTGAFPVISAPPGTGLGPPSANPRLPEAAMTLIGEARTTLQRADAELSDIDARIKRSPGARNGIIYFSYAVLFALAQVPLLFMLVVEDGIAPVAAVPCGVMLVFVSFALAWLTIGFAYQEPSGLRPRRTPVLGMLISLIAGTPAFVSTLWTIFEVFG
ncbi:hypothetical protein [Virgisporangium aurantiacum]|uniref:Uncharacterized protein n=1 Tax=Virgisporangium aurantiacum TaxID=175570 RepID=A0A8J4DWU5_9ACTN|nr:hypothetical protein [Virgisporangium aurantiacum]GIJ53860.1 hypothetical protein Vau01_013760 [Virgisporangium aurantiacum]